MFLAPTTPMEKEMPNFDINGRNICMEIYLIATLVVSRGVKVGPLVILVEPVWTKMVKSLMGSGRLGWLDRFTLLILFRPGVG